MLANPPRVLDLFCGAGGLAEGFRQAGFEIAGGLDNDPIALTTFERNHPNAMTFLGDIRNVSSEVISEVGPIDVLVGGPSCQGFSTHGKRIAEDPRNFLFREFIRVVRDFLPPWVVIENVKGLLWYDKGAFRQRIHEALEELGYDVRSGLHLAADFGVPQRRERIIFVATNTGCDIPFPRPTHGPMTDQAWLSVRDAVGDLPSLGLGGRYEGIYPEPALSEYQSAMRRNCEFLTMHEATPISDRALAIVRRIPQGKGIRHLSEDELPDRFQRMRTISNGKLRRDCTTLYHRLAWDLPSYTITCYFRNVSSGPFVHPEDDRALSFREAARLQSFADDYIFDRRALARQIGNAVPPLMAKSVADAILRASRDDSAEVAAQRYAQIALA